MLVTDQSVAADGAARASPEATFGRSTLVRSVDRAARSRCPLDLVRSERPELAWSAWYWAAVVSWLTVVRSAEALVASATSLAAAADVAAVGIAMPWTWLAKADM